MTLLDNRYELIDVLGKGAFGQTFLAKDTRKFNDHKCVVKQLIYQAKNDAEQKFILGKFEQEAKLLYELGNHPQIPSLDAFFAQDLNGKTGYFLVQEFIEGSNLFEERQQVGPFTEEKIRKLLIDFLPVLSFVHSKDVIHKDIKPPNLMRKYMNGDVFLIDFGISKKQTQSKLGIPGSIGGTPGFSAPEQLQYGLTSPGADLYSLAASCVCLVMKQTDTLDDIIVQHLENWVYEWHQSIPMQISQEFVSVLTKMLSPKPDERYQSAESVLDVLRVSPKAAATNIIQASSTQSKSEIPLTIVPSSKTKKKTKEHVKQARKQNNIPPTQIEGIPSSSVEDGKKVKAQNELDALLDSLDSLNMSQASKEKPLSPKKVYSPTQTTRLPKSKPKSSNTSHHQSRRGFLSFLGLSGLGLGSALLYSLFRNGSNTSTLGNDPQSGDSPTLLTKSFSFNTFRVDERGDVAEQVSGT